MNRISLIKILILTAVMSLITTSCYTQLALAHRDDAVYTEQEEPYYDEEVYYEDEQGNTYISRYYIYDYPAVYSYRYSVYDPWDPWYDSYYYSGPYIVISAYPWAHHYDRWYWPYDRWYPIYTFGYGPYYHDYYYGYPYYHHYDNNYYSWKNYEKRSFNKRQSSASGVVRSARTSSEVSSRNNDQQTFVPVRQAPGAGAVSGSPGESSEGKTRSTEVSSRPVRTVNQGDSKSSGRTDTKSGRTDKTTRVKRTQDNSETNTVRDGQNSGAQDKAVERSKNTPVRKYYRTTTSSTKKRGTEAKKSSDSGSDKKSTVSKPRSSSSVSRSGSTKSSGSKSSYSPPSRSTSTVRSTPAKSSGSSSKSSSSGSSGKSSTRSRR